MFAFFSTLSGGNQNVSHKTAREGRRGRKFEKFAHPYARTSFTPNNSRCLRPYLFAQTQHYVDDICDLSVNLTGRSKNSFCPKKIFLVNLKHLEEFQACVKVFWAHLLLEDFEHICLLFAVEN